MAFGRFREAVDQAGEIGMLAGLNKTEMTFRQRQRRFARQCTEDRNTERGDRARDQRAVPFAGDAVENYSGDAHGRIVRNEATHQSRGRLCLPRNIEHQHDRQIEMGGEVGGGAASAGNTGAIGRTIKQTHHAFDHKDIRA